MNRQLIVYESLAKTCNEFDKLRVMRACVSTCLCVSVVYVATCHRRANFSFLRASVSKNVLTAIRRANVSTWCAVVLKAVPFFKLFSYEMRREICILYYII